MHENERAAEIADGPRAHATGGLIMDDAERAMVLKTKAEWKTLSELAERRGVQTLFLSFYDFNLDYLRMRDLLSRGIPDAEIRKEAQ